MRRTHDSARRTQHSLEEHLATLAACRLCPNVLGEPVIGAVPDARVLLVGQAPGPREMVDKRPFAFTAGRRLFGWFERLGVAEDRFRSSVYMCAVIRCFPGRDEKAGGDRVPAPEEIANCASHLDREIAILGPKLVIAVGTLAAQQLIGASKLNEIVGRKHRATRAGRTFDVVVLPHPSGRSTWTNKPENAALLDQSLDLIATHPAWKATFGAPPSRRLARRRPAGAPSLTPARTRRA